MNRQKIALFLTASAFGLAGLSGCGKEGTTGGTPNSNKPLIGKPEGTFSIVTHSLSIKPGGKAEGSVGIKRGDKFTQDVSVSFDNLPKGVSIDPAKPTIPNGASDVKFNVAATDEAAAGDFKVKVTGHPASGDDSVAEWNLTVKKPDTFSMNTPGNVFWTAGIKQGETKAFSISVSRDKDFHHDVALKFDGLPKGVTIDPAAPTNKNGESEVKVNVKAADDAAVGEHTVKVTGTPTKGAPVVQDFKLKVNSK
jgi:hypothetical protein